MTVTLRCLHGFLGEASDWEGILNSYLEYSRYNLFSSDLSPASIPPIRQGLSKLGEWVNQSIPSRSGSQVLVGYSLGGRIALHSLIQAPHLWSAAVIISAHLGLAEGNQADRTTRRKSDEVWATRFEKDDWGELMRDWNAQDVLKSTIPAPKREEGAYSRPLLVDALRQCSLGNQMDLRPFLRHIPIPILWISGEQDAKYQAIALEAAKLNPRFDSRVIPGGGHRILWERPKELSELVMGFLREAGLL